MGRVLGNRVNEIVIADSISGDEILYFFRLPSTEERVKYMGGLFKPDGEEMIVDYGFKAEQGLNLVTGFRKGDFADSEGNPYSSDENDDEFLPEWRDMLREECADHLMMIAAHVFERTQVKKKVNGLPGR